MKHIFQLGFAALSAIVLTSCKPEKGIAPKTTESGITGSEWFLPASAAKGTWQELGTLSGGKYYRTEMNAPDIDANIMENSVILVYAKFSGYDQSIWEEGSVGILPRTVFTSIFANAVDDWSVAVSPGKISIRLQNSLDFYPTGGPDKGHAFRYIIVPKSSARVTGQKPGNPNPLSQYSENELRNLTYDELCLKSGLKK